MSALNLEIPKKLLLDFLEGCIDIKGFLENILDDKGAGENNNAFHLSIELQYNYSGGGTSKIDGFKITDIAFHEKEQKGDMVLNYTVHYWYGCADMSNSDTDYQKIEFEIDQNQSILLLKFPKKAIRDTVEEF